MRHKEIRFSIPFVAVLLVLAACGGSPDPRGVGGDVDHNKTLRVALTYAPTTLDPHRSTAPVAGHVYITPLYDRLAQMGPDLVLEPMLATKWSFGEDGRSVTFSLRDDAKFWDGTSVDAAAVEASLNRAMTLPDSTAAVALSMIETVEAVDATTVKITTNRPAADVPFALAGIEGAVINPKAISSATLDQEPAGSGAYELEKTRSGDELVLKRHEGYWDQKANAAKRIMVSGIPNDSSRINALRSGQVDLIMTTVSQYKQAKSLGDSFETHDYPQATTYSVWLNSALPNTDNKLVRQALNWAIDRQSINTSLLNGQCEPAGQQLAPVFEGHLDDPPISYGYDPAKARKLLANAGVPNGFKMKMLVPNGITLYEQMATAIQAQLKDIGVDVELSPQESATIFTSWSASKEFGGWLNSRSGKPTSGMTLEANFLNPARYPGPTPEGFGEAVRGTLNPQLEESEVKASLENASRIGVDNAMDVYICSAGALWTSTDRVTGADTMGQSYFTSYGDLRFVGVS